MSRQPRPKNRRQPYKGAKSQRDLAAHVANTAAPETVDDMDRIMADPKPLTLNGNQQSAAPAKVAVPVHTPAAAPKVAVPVPRSGGGHGKLIAAGVVGGAAAGTGGVLYARHKRRKAAEPVTKLINPFEDEVSKAYKVALPIQSSTPVSPRRQRSGPTQSHGNDLERYGRRKTGRPVMIEVHHKEGVHKGAGQYGSTAARRGTPMGDVGRQARNGRRL